MAPTNGHGKPRLTLDAALDRTQKKLALIEGRNKLRAHQMVRTRQKKILESYEAWEWLSGYSDMLDRMRGPDRDLLLPVSTAQDRRYGDNWPFWRSWVEHSRLRAASRLLCQLSPLASGAIWSLTAYVIGEGMKTRAQAKRPDCPKPLIQAVQEWLDAFAKANAWHALQQELFFRARRDGEYFVRIFPQDDGMTLVRTVEPEHVIEPPDQPRDIGSYGIIVDPEDLWDVRGYYVSYSGSADDGEYLHSSQVWHHRTEFTDRQVKRGIPDFAFDTLDLYKTVGRLLENTGQGAAIQAAIAFVRQHESASPAAVNSFIGSLADYQQTQPFTGNSRNVMRFEPGTVIDMDAGQSFQETSFGANVGNYIQAVQALLRACAVRWNAPEWVVSADNSSVNYASSLTSESPFTKRCKMLQQTQKDIFDDVVSEALRHYCRQRRGFKVGNQLYDYRMLRQLVDLQTVPASVETRDKSQEASMNQTYIQLGIKSRQTAAAELGLDYEVEERNNEEFEKKHGEQGIPADQRTAEGGDDGAMAAMLGGGGEGENGDTPDAAQNPQKPQKPDSGAEDDGLGDMGALLASLTEAALTATRQQIEAGRYLADMALQATEGLNR